MSCLSFHTSSETGRDVQLRTESSHPGICLQRAAALIFQRLWASAGGGVRLSLSVDTAGAHVHRAPLHNRTEPPPVHRKMQALSSRVASLSLARAKAARPMSRTMVRRTRAR